MTDTRTSSMLQRLPVILAVTAASYGLQVPAHAAARVGGIAAKQNRTTLPVDARPIAVTAAKHRT
jgi:hypothetical protein